MYFLRFLIGVLLLRYTRIAFWLLWGVFRLYKGKSTVWHAFALKNL